MEKLSKRFYEDIKNEIEYELEELVMREYDPNDIYYRPLYQQDEYGANYSTELVLSDGYVAEVYLYIRADIIHHRSTYDEPGYDEGEYYWKVTSMEIYDKDDDLVEVLKGRDAYDYMSGEGEIS